MWLLIEGITMSTCSREDQPPCQECTRAVLCQANWQRNWDPPSPTQPIARMNLPAIWMIHFGSGSCSPSQAFRWCSPSWHTSATTRELTSDCPWDAFLYSCPMETMAIINDAVTPLQLELICYLAWDNLHSSIGSDLVSQAVYLLWSCYPYSPWVFPSFIVGV